MKRDPFIPLFDDRNSPDARLERLRASDEERTLIADRILCQVVLMTNDCISWGINWSDDGHTLRLYCQMTVTKTSGELAHEGGSASIDDHILAHMTDLYMVASHLAHHAFAKLCNSFWIIPHRRHEQTNIIEGG